MPEVFYNKIKYLCNKIPLVEWSGVLFYSTKGNITQPEKFQIQLEEIFLMDIGSSAYTEYELNEDLIEYRMENPESLDWKIGHIHSHNNMRVFFSGTDTEELKDNSKNHNYYLSLIVNNDMDFCAKVAFQAESEAKVVSSPFTARDSNGKKYKIGEQSEEAVLKSSKMYVFDCKIDNQTQEILVSDQFKERYKDIVDAKAEAKRVLAAKKAVKPWVNKTPSWYSKSVTPKVWGTVPQEDEDDLFSWDPSLKEIEDDPVEMFIVNLMRIGKDVPGDSFIQVVTDLSTVSDRDDELYITRLITYLPELYSNMFGLNTIEDMEEFIDFIDQILMYFSEWAYHAQNLDGLFDDIEKSLIEYQNNLTIKKELVR